MGVKEGKTEVDYTYFWKGKGWKWRQDTESRISHLYHIFHQLPNLPAGVYERLMEFYFSISGFHQATVSRTYSPTLTSCEDNKEAFYEILNSLVKLTPGSEKLIVI